ncbi:PPR domain-containing protein/PPR_2 domain-containing protein [Cephalotus follicularis]|uniref:PPR domain-containing protein/PPR_2 domain-containing protein n=1 Tax=Cephalotus follicularis TaxID=3775 RepID=A0A1Q3C765_CEPFO|nr:PPR domain-containing protein/PPR_2 domain-containing protein [Cephalotus follicularis]
MKKLNTSTTTALPLIKTLITQNHHPQALRSSLSLHSPILTDQIYSLFIKKGHPLDPILSTTLITHFSKLGHLSSALTFLFDTPRPDVITFNATISGLARFRQPGPVFELFNRLRQWDLVPDVFTFSSLVKVCESLRENESAHCVCLMLGFGFNAFVVSGLIENYAKSGALGSAERCFRECLDMDNVVFTAMICGYVWNEEFDMAKEVFVEMIGLGFEVNEFSLSGLMGALFHVREGEQIHGFGVKMGFLCGGSIHLSNAVTSMYNRCGRKLSAVMVFDEISEPDVFSWTERIGASYDSMEALKLFNDLHGRGLEMNEYIVTTVLSAVGHEMMLKSGKQIQALCHKAGYLDAVSVGNALISMYGECSCMDDARCVFDNMAFRDFVSWNSLIAGYSGNRLVTQALEVLSKMRDLLIRLNNYTIASILEVVSYLNSLTLAVQIHSCMIKTNFMLDESMVSCLITTYGRCSGIDESKRVFFEIDKINVVHINAMTSTLVHAGFHADAVELFQITRSSCIEVDNTTFSIILKACGALTDLGQGSAIHSLALKLGFVEDIYVGSAIIDIYCKCGSIGDAEKAFRGTSRHNLAACNAMMMGYAQHGHHHDVFKLHKEMSEFGIEPDEITYLGVLTSCCHAGLVEEAHTYLYSMFEFHGVIPHLEHYACMVDLLGRVGLLEDAKRTIDQMTIQPDARIWQILLSACNIHGNVDLGRVAASKLFELQPDNESAYVLLSNLYASAGMWNATGKLRKEMKEKVIRKEPGSSWIQVGGSTHYFFADDMSHPDTKEIFAELLRLCKQISPDQEELVLF